MRACLFGLLMVLAACPPSGGGNTGGGSGRTGGGSGSSGGGSGSNGGGTGATGGAITFTTLGWERASLVSGADGTLHLLFAAGDNPFTVQYGRCASNCGSASSWTLTVIEQGAPRIGRTELAIASDGRLHARFDLDGSNDEPIYATCAGDCSMVGNWKKVNLTAVLGGTTAELWGHPMAVDSSGRVSFITSDQRFPADIRLNSCAANCDNAANWTSALIRSDGRKSSMVAQGGTLHHLIDDGAGNLRYRTCASNCTSAASWTESGPLFAHDYSQPTAIAVSANGTVHVAYNQGMVSGQSAQVEAQNDRLLYWQCASNCMDPASWSGTVFNAAEGQKGLAMAERNGAVVLGLAQGLEATAKLCTSGCTDGAKWRTVTLDSQARMTADVDPYSVRNCTNNNTPPELATWFPEEPTVAIQPDGTAAIAWGMWMNRQCPGSVLARQQGYGRFTLVR